MGKPENAIPLTREKLWKRCEWNELLEF